MQNILTLGRHLIPVEHIVWIEAFDPAQNRTFTPTGRIVPGSCW